MSKNKTITLGEVVEKVNAILKANFELDDKNPNKRIYSYEGVTKLISDITGYEFVSKMGISLSSKSPVELFKVTNKRFKTGRIDFYGRKETITTAYSIAIVSWNSWGTLLGSGVTIESIQQMVDKHIKSCEKRNENYFNSIKEEFEGLLQVSGMSKKKFNELMDKIDSLPREEKEMILGE
jgi:hypothetical protein